MIVGRSVRDPTPWISLAVQLLPQTLQNFLDASECAAYAIASPFNEACLVRRRCIGLSQAPAQQDGCLHMLGMPCAPLSQNILTASGLVRKSENSCPQHCWGNDIVGNQQKIAWIPPDSEHSHHT